jgi:regulator of sirC expression with transglutaminase-like and TPR domain
MATSQTRARAPGGRAGAESDQGGGGRRPDAHRPGALANASSRHNGSISRGSFQALAARPDASLDELALALAGELRQVDSARALDELDRLAAELAPVAGTGPEDEEEALRDLLGRRHGFFGDRDDYYHPRNSMLDLVLERRRGLPILLSAVYVEVARRAGIALAGIGLPGHFIVGHYGETPPRLLDPFSGGERVELETDVDLRPSSPHETAGRMLNNLVAAYRRRGDLARAIRAAEMRLGLPLGESEEAAFEADLRSLRARLN